MFAANYEMALGEKGGGRGEGGRGGRKGEGRTIEEGLWGRRVGGEASSGRPDRGPFILRARADRELALGGDTAHKSETITACRHTHKHTHRCDHTVCVHTHTHTSCVHCGLSHLRETALPPPVLPHPSLPVSLLFLLHPLFWSVGLIEDAL